MALRAAAPRHVSVPREPSTSTRALAIAVAVAVLVGLVGFVLLGLMLRERAAVVGADSAGGLQLSVTGVEWAQLEHDSVKGFQMPASMMPGAPAPGQERLAVNLSIFNRSGSAHPFSVDEFTLLGPDGQARPVATNSLDDGSLGAKLGLNGTVTFDFPEAIASQRAPAFVLVWRHAGKVVRQSVTVGGSPHVHQ